MLAAVISAVLALLAVPSPEALAAEPAVSLFAYAYDGQHSPAVVASDAFERGPPVCTSTASTYYAADRRSSGLSAIAGRAANPTAYTYDDVVDAVQVAKTSATTSEVTPDVQRTPALASRLHVAAKGVDELADFGRAGIHQFPGTLAGKSQFFEGLDAAEGGQRLRVPWRWPKWRRSEEFRWPPKHHRARSEPWASLCH